jgi:HSP20 family protein
MHPTLFNGNIPSYKLFEDFWTPPKVYKHRYTLPTELHEGESGYWLTIEVPGVEQEDIHINLEGNELTVRTTREEQTKTNTWTLPKTVDVDKVEATLRNGLLRITLPTIRKHSRTIEIK